jgi:hypothetical protein
VTIKPVSTTMGQSTLAGISGVGWYRYNGDKPHEGPSRAEALPQNIKATTAKQKRMAEYTRRRLAKETKEQAAAAIEISASTMGYYERAFLDEHPEARP